MSSGGRGHGRGLSSQPWLPQSSSDCYQCGDPGHIAWYCTKKAQDRCFNCYGLGHGDRECTSPHYPDGLCYTCGTGGHTMSSCTNQNPPLVCSKCSGVGHLHSKCATKQSVMKCSRCGDPNHMVRDCPSRQDEDGDYTAYRGDDACASCGARGHFAPACPKYKVDWSNI